VLQLLLELLQLLLELLQLLLPKHARVRTSIKAIEAWMLRVAAAHSSQHGHGSQH
jgi:hypothetical protein